MFAKTLIPARLRHWLTAPLGWCFLASILAHSGLWYLWRWLDPLAAPVVRLSPPIEVQFIDPPAVSAVRPSPSPAHLGAPVPPPPPLANLPPSDPLPPLPPPDFAKPVPAPVTAPPQPRSQSPAPPPPQAAPTPMPLPPPVDTPSPTSEPFDPTNTRTSDGLGNLSRWLASLQPELDRSPKLLRLTEPLPKAGCPWAKSGPAVLGVVVNPQGQIEGTPELLRSTGYATLNRQARQVTAAYTFTEYAAETIQAVMVEVNWENVCPEGT